MTDSPGNSPRAGAQLPERGGPPPDGHQRQCTAKAKRTGSRCRGWALHGQDVCGKHGGLAPQNLAAARRRIDNAKAVEAAARLGVPIDVDPQQALLDELHRTAGIVMWLRAELDRDAGSRQIEQVVDTAAWRAWHEQRQHLARVAADCIRCGIAERQVRLAESQGALIADVLRKVFDDPELGLDPKGREVCRRVAGRHLRAVAG